jgi:large subunit ribosomal protein L22
MIEAHATARYVRTSAQKAGLVLDLIRGKAVPQALATLKFSPKGVARDIEKVLRSAVANATQKEGFGGDTDRLVVKACYANQGPSQKRIRPAPMGRAFRVVKRTAHISVEVVEKPETLRTTAPAARKPRAGAKPAGGARKAAAPREKKAPVRAAKKTPVKSGSAE